MGGGEFLSINSITKNAAAYTDKGAAFPDGYGIVVAHAHGEFAEIFPV